MRILVAEQDHALGIFLQRGFGAENYEVEIATDARQAGTMADVREYDAAILDLDLAAPEDVDLLRQVRSRREALPILILTAHPKADERARVFDLGADDLVVKPFAFAELAARLRAMLRRGSRSADTLLCVEDLELNRVERTVTRAGRRIELTPKEFSLLEYLMRNAGQRVTRTQIIQHVWNLSFDTMTNVVDIYINYSSSQVDKRRVGQLAMAIQVAFQQMGIFDASNSRPEMIDTEPMPFSRVQMVENEKRNAALGRLVNSPQPELTDGPWRPDMQAVDAQLEAALAPEIKKQTVTVTRTREGIVVSLKEMGFFNSGSAALRADAVPTITDLIRVIRPIPVRIRIEGHTDNIPIHTVRFDSNWELSTARATEMIKLFIANFGMSPDRLSASGYAEYYPVASNETADGRAKNRRVDLVILNSGVAQAVGPSGAQAAPH